MILETIYKCRVMKIINTLSVLFFLLVAVACSSEGDTIMNDIDKEVEASSEAVAFFDIALANDGIQTRSSEKLEDQDPNANEYSLNNCFIAVFNNDTKAFITSYLYQKDELGSCNTENGNFQYSLSKRISVKVNNTTPKLLFVAIAQTNDASGEYEVYSTRKNLLSCTNYNDLQDIIIRENPAVMVKCGEVVLDNYRAVESLKHQNHESCNQVTIPLFQRSAAIQLESFKVLDANNKNLDATITSLQLKNMKMFAKVKGEVNRLSSELASIYDGVYFEDYSGQVYSTDQFPEGWMNRACFYTYENTNSDRPTTFIINYSVGTETGHFEVAIESPNGTKEILAGNFYKLDVTIKNAVATATIKCSTNDWEEGGVIEVPVQK